MPKNHKKQKRRKQRQATVHVTPPQAPRLTTAAAAAATTASSGSTSSTSSSSCNLPPPFPSHLSKPPQGFLKDESPYRDSFQAAMEGPYEGFVIDDDPRELLLSSSSSSSSAVRKDRDAIHQEARVSDVLHHMNDRGEFREDVTQPFGLGTKCAKTYVTRCLVGEPGTSYKYLGLRMFAAPFGSNDDTRTIQRLGAVLSDRATHHVKDLTTKRRARRAPLPKGTLPTFDICLINRMSFKDDLKPTIALPSDSSVVVNNKNNNKDEAKTSVSWHADSSLEHYSTIAVYQTLETSNDDDNDSNDSSNVKNGSGHSSTNNNNNNKDWWVGLRVAHHAEGPQASSGRKGSSIEASLVPETPPIAISLPSGSAYYLLDDFNHHHQHIVFTTGKDTTTSTVRYSCTFRKLRESHNVEYWIERGNALKKSFNKKGVKLWKAEYLVSQELEFEWIRQFYVQGKRHYDCLWDLYWKTPIQELLSLWSCVEHRAFQTLELLRAAAEAKCGVDDENSKHQPSRGERKERDRRRKALSTVETLLSRCETEEALSEEGALSQLYVPMAECLEEQAKKRELWEKREKDHVFREMHHGCRPLSVPFRFYRTVGEAVPSACEWGSSPFPKSPSALRNMAKEIRQLGQAFDTSDLSKLPLLSWKHAMSLEWGGWEEGTFGLELQEPWAAAVVNGSKSIETRLYTLPPLLVGKTIFVLESKSGKAGVSNLGNFIDIERQQEVKNGGSMTGNANVNVIGWCVISSVKEYNDRHGFERDESQHLVSSNSGYGWKENGEPIFGWVIGDYHRYSDDDNSQKPAFFSGVRRYRSLFELQASCRSTIAGVDVFHGKAAVTQAKTGKHKKWKRHNESNRDDGGTAKKRKRF